MNDKEIVKYKNPVKQLGFAQIFHIITLDNRISDGAFRLYCRYIYYAQQKDTCWPGRITLAKKLSVGPATISRWNKELESAGYITRKRRLGKTSITWIEDVEQSDHMKKCAVDEIEGRKSSCIIDDTTIVSQVQHVTSQECAHEEEPIKKNHRTKNIAQAQDSFSGLKVYPPTDVQAEYIEVELTEYTREILCPECGEKQEWPRPARLRKKKDNLVCSKCDTYWKVIIEYDSGQSDVYKFPLPKQDWAIVLDDEIPKLGNRFYCDEKGAKEFLANWKENPGLVVEKLQWAAMQDWLVHQKAKIVPRVNAAFETAMKGKVQAAQPQSTPDPYDTAAYQGMPKEKIAALKAFSKKQKEEDDAYEKEREAAWQRLNQ